MDLNIGLLGCGTVGSGVIELTERRADKIESMTGLRPVIRRVLVRDLAKPRSVNLTDTLLTTDVNEILEDDSIQLVIETIGGIEPAREFVLAALRRRKHVVTANKDLIALHGAEILQVAKEAQVDIMYEAAVGGAIPLIRPLRESLTANHITNLKGIINGTTNYILTKMTELGMSFEAALREAQELGFAEADPTSDVDGLDAARKLAILASIAFDTPVLLSDVSVQGIRSVTDIDVKYADELGTVIKLLAVGSERNGKLTLEVRPSLVPKEHPLAHVSESYNALFVHGDAAGDLMFFGQGAGSLPTASAILGDVIETLRNIKLGVISYSDASHLPHKPVQPFSTTRLPYYMRLSVSDVSGVFADIARIFSEYDISMETVIQKRIRAGVAGIVVVTHPVAMQQIRQVVTALESRDTVHHVHTVMPVES